MNVIFTCGGTGGHINPAIAVAKLLRERRPGWGILFVGAEDGMERDLVPREGFRLETLTISNFQRKLTPAGLWHNVKTLRNLHSAFRKADRILDAFQPDVILGTGGYASYPTLRQGARRGIPTAVHEANAVPGLTTKLVAKRAERIASSSPACRCARSSSIPPAPGRAGSWAWTAGRWWSRTGAAWAPGK